MNAHSLPLVGVEAPDNLAIPAALTIVSFWIVRALEQSQHCLPLLESGTGPHNSAQSDMRRVFAYFAKRYGAANPLLIDLYGGQAHM